MDSELENSDQLFFADILAYKLLEASFKIFLACDEVVESFACRISDAILVLKANKLKAQGKEPIYTDDKNDRGDSLSRYILKILHSLFEVTEMFKLLNSQIFECLED